MKPSHVAIVLAICSSLLACQKPDQGKSPDGSSSKTDAQSENPGLAKFEIRDYTTDEHEESYGGTTFKGRGSLLTKDPRLTKGTFMVWVSAKKEHSNGDKWVGLVLMMDGLATIETYDYIPSKERGKPVRYTDWEIIGYVELNQAQLASSPNDRSKS